MYNRLMGMKTQKDVYDVSIALECSTRWSQLCAEISAQGVAFFADDLWSPEYLKETVQQNGDLERVLAATDKEETSTKLLHRLQLVSYYDPELRAPIAEYLTRACV